MEFRARRRRKAISPVLATIMLVAITLIASIAVAGFVFGLMGSFVATAEVSVTYVTCSGTPESCVIALTNSGSGSTSVTGVCSLTFGGQSYLGSATLVSGSLSGGNVAQVSCVSGTLGSHAVSGSQVTGYVTIGNGANALFSTSAQ